METRLGKGNRPALFLVPTTDGLRTVNKPLLMNGRGGAVHRHFQETVANHARSLGYEVHKEYRIESGGSVDVHLSKEGIAVAVEIAIHSRPERECHNILKCLDAGYDRVMALFLDLRLLQETRSLFVKDATLEQRQRVIFLEVGRVGDELK